VYLVRTLASTCDLLNESVCQITSTISNLNNNEEKKIIVFLCTFNDNVAFNYIELFCAAQYDKDDHEVYCEKITLKSLQ
jgi:hypothetical protein